MERHPLRCAAWCRAQVWFELPETLVYKYRLVKQYGLLGVAIWNLGSLDHASSDPRVSWGYACMHGTRRLAWHRCMRSWHGVEQSLHWKTATPLFSGSGAGYLQAELLIVFRPSPTLKENQLACNSLLRLGRAGWCVAGASGARGHVACAARRAGHMTWQQAKIRAWVTHSTVCYG